MGIHPTAIIEPGAVLGKAVEIGPYSTIDAEVVIGDNTTIGARVSIQGKTRLGVENRIFDGAIIGCRLHNRVTLANCVTLAGHVEIEDDATVGGLAAIHQFTRVGKLSMIGGCSKVVQDVPPFMLCDGHPARTVTINTVGLKRAKMSACDLALLKKAHRLVFRSGMRRSKALAELAGCSNCYISDFLTFMAASSRGVAG